MRTLALEVDMVDRADLADDVGLTDGVDFVDDVDLVDEVDLVDDVDLVDLVDGVDIGNGDMAAQTRFSRRRTPGGPMNQYSRLHGDCKWISGNGLSH